MAWVARWLPRWPRNRQLKVFLLISAGTPMLAAGLGGVLRLFPLPESISAFLFIAGGLTLAEGLVRRSRIQIGHGSAFARTKVEAMIRVAESRILIISGGLNPSTYPLELLADKIRSGVWVELISAQGLPENVWRILNGFFKYDNFRLYLFPGDPSPHGMLVDGRFLRLESPRRGEGSARENVFIEYPASSAALFLKSFERYKAQAQLVRGVPLESG